MSDAPPRLLLVEDSPGDVRLIREMFAETPDACGELVHADSVAAATGLLGEGRFDGVLLDLSLPDGHGLETLQRVRASAADIPVVVLTGFGDDAMALRAVQEGAQDYIVKGEFDARGLSRSILYAIERRRADRVEQERRTLENTLGAMDQLLGVLGHELRTPLTSLRLLSEYMLSDNGEVVHQWDTALHSINSEVRRMSELVNNLLEAARLDSGVSQWHWSTVNAETVCAEALEVLGPLVDPAKVKLKTEVEPQGLSFGGDPDAIRRLLVNLINNAVKHTPEGEINVSLHKLDRNGEPWINLSIRDTGAGISDDIAARLGTAFAINSGVAGSSLTGGTGLGLAICKGIAAAHGGTISVASTVGQGSTFTVLLRADLAAPAAIPEGLKIIRQAAA